MADTTAAPAAIPEPHSAPGGAVHPTGLKPRSKVRTMRCGCASDDTRHIAFCAAQFELLKIHKARVAASRGDGARTHEADPLLA